MVPLTRLWCMASAMFSRSDKISDRFLVPSTFLQLIIIELLTYIDSVDASIPESCLSQQAGGPAVVIIVTDGAKGVGNLVKG